MDQNDANRGMSQAPKEFLALTHGQEWVSFYESFDKLVQDHLARSSELLRRAMTLPEVADREVAQVRAELEAKLAAERQRSRELLAKVSEEITTSHRQVASLASAVGSLVAELESLGKRVAEALASYDLKNEDASVDKSATVWPEAPLNGSGSSGGTMTATAPAERTSTVTSTAPETAARPFAEAAAAEQPVSAQASAEVSPEVEPASAINLAAMATAEVESEQPAIDTAVSAGTGLPAGQATATADEVPSVPVERPRPHWLSVTRMGSRP